MSEENSISEKKVLQEDEIDLVELVKSLWFSKWFIAKVTGVFVILGLIIAFTSPKEYDASCILIPEAIEGGGKLGGSLGGLASLAGVDLGGFAQGGTTINPGLYKSVAESTPFLLALMNEKFQFDEVDSDISLYDYYMNHYRTSLFSKILLVPSRIFSLVKGTPDTLNTGSVNSNILVITKDQKSVADDLKERINVSMDWDLNIVRIDIEMQDPRVTAQIAEFTREYITKYVTNYSVSKSREQLSFVEKQFIQRKSEFQQAQLRLATFRDRNINVNSARAKSEEERLQSEYNLAFNIYNQLAQQQESIKLQVNENTPVFTVLEPVRVPVEKSAPRRFLILFVFAMLGTLFGVGISLFRNSQSL